MPSQRTLQLRWLAVAGSLALGAAGCTHANVHASAPVSAPPTASLSDAERPMTIAPDTNAVPPVEATTAPPPTVAENSNPEPVTIPEAKAAPALRKPPEPVTEAAAAPARPPAPQISPQLSPGDQASYERRTTEDVSVAEKNLQGTQGKQLNAAQQDLVDKIRSFLAQSREASKSGDWARAQNLAQKARLLSVELVNSL